MRFRESKWEDFLEGFHYIYSALDAYNADKKWGYSEFWETINTGWYSMYIFDYDDPYNPTISKERKLRLSQEPEIIYLSHEDFDALVKKIEEPPQYNENLAKLFQRKSLWNEQ